MNSIPDRVSKDYGRGNSSSVYSSGDIFEPLSSINAKQRAKLVEWLNSVLPHLSLPINASDEDLRAFLVDGSVLCQLLNKLKPGSVPECGGTVHSPELHSENIKRFLSAMDEMCLPRFQASDLEKGSMKIVLECLLTLQEEFSRTQSSPSPGERQKTGSDSKFQRALRSPIMTEPSAALIHHVGHKFHEVFQLKQGSHTEIPAAKISEMMRSNSLDIAPTQSLLSVVNGILDESIERKNGEIPQRVACLLRKVVQEIERRITTLAEHLRTQNNLFKTREQKYQSRIRVLEARATGTSEETQNEKNKTEGKKKNEEQDVPKLEEKDNQIVALKQELEITKNSYESKEKEDHGQEITALKKELEIVKKSYELKEKEDNRQEITSLKQELEIVKKSYESKEKEGHWQEITALKQELEMVKKSYESKEKEDPRQEIAALKQELEIVKKSYELKEKEEHSQEIAALKQELEIVKKLYELKEKEEHSQEIAALKQEMEIAKNSYELKEKEDHRQEIAALKQEMEIAKKLYEQHTLEMEEKATEAQQELEEKLKEATGLLAESRNRIKELETFSQSKLHNWKKKEHIYQIFTDFQLGALRVCLVSFLLFKIFLTCH